MASRVNTKFVVILIVAVIAMLGALFAAYTVVYKTAADLEALGDQAMAENDSLQARAFYAKAVNKDRTNPRLIEKWISALEIWTPETETAYYDAYRGDYMGAIYQASAIQRTNIAAYERELGMDLETLYRGFSRGLADRLITRTTEILGYFDAVPGVDPEWPTLRRYRGLAWERIGATDGVVDESQYELVREDLEAAVAARPNDDLARSGLMRWIVYEAVQKSDEQQLAKGTDARREAVEIGTKHLEQYPDSPMVMLTRLMIEMEIARTEAMDANPRDDSARTAAIQNALRDYQPRIAAVEQKLLSLPASDLTTSVLNNFRLVEYLADPESNLERSIELFMRAIDARPGSSDLLLSAAAIFTSQGNNDRATEMYERLVALPIPPLSMEGVMLFGAQREALITMASNKLNEYERLKATPDSDPAEISKIFAEAVSARDQYAARVSEDNTILMLIDGQIAYANGEIEESLRLFKQFVGLIDNPRMKGRGLWLEAISARELNQNGTARDALIALLQYQKYDVRALLMLAEIETRLQNFREAKARYEQVLVYDPENRVARSGITNLNALENPELIDDPALSLIVKARGIRRGDDENPGDVAAAISVLSEGIESVDYAPMATRELASMLLDQGDIVGARALITKALEANPDSDDLTQLLEAVQSDDEVEILVAMAKNSSTDRLEQLVSIARIAFSRGRTELLDETLGELLEIAPDDERVLDFAFVRALESGNLTQAETMAKRAKTNNTDRVNGLSYQARIAAYQKDHARATQLLEQATSSGTADSSLYRMLALEQLELGRTDAALQAFEQALNVSPDDQSSILAYLNALVNLRRYPEALDIARRFQRFANDNPQFMFLWLSLEAQYGGPEGQQYAIRQREKFLELDPKNQYNKYALADLYIQTSQWSESRRLIDDLKSDDDAFELVELEARWYANQGRVGNVDGLSAARKVYLDYIRAHESEKSARPYIGLAEFMVQRGRHEFAIQAAMDAVEREDPETMEGTKLLGNLFMMLNNYTNAADTFKKIVDSGKDDDDQYRLRLIDMLIRTRQFTAARVQFDLLDPSHKTEKIAMLQNSEIEEGLGNMKAASDILDNTVASYSDDPLVYIKRAEFLAGSPDTLTDMLADVDAALQIDPNDWRAYRVRAAGYFAVDQREDAMRDLMRAVQLNPMLDQALFGIVNELMIDGRNSDAFDFASEIVIKRQNNAKLIESLGDLFSSRDDWEHAVKFYKLAWDAQRSPGSGATLIDAIVRTRNPDTNLANAVINDLTEIAGDINGSPGLLAAQALVLQARGRDELALQQLTKAFDLSSNNDTFLIQWSGNISRFFMNRSMQDQIQYIDTLKRRNPNKEVLNWLDLFIAQRLISANVQRDTVVAIFERLMGASSQPEIQRITFQSYGQALYAEGDHEKAAEIWGRGVELFPNDWEMGNNLAYVLSSEMGQHERALGLALKAVEHNSERPEPYDTLGNIYTALGQYDKAEEALNEGMKFAFSARSRVTLIIAQIELDLARGKKAEAHSKLIDIRSLMRSMPTRDTGLESEVDATEAKINSAG